MNLVSITYNEDGTNRATLGYEVKGNWQQSDAVNGIVISEARDDVPTGQLTQACRSGIRGLGHSPPHYYLINAADLKDFNAKYPVKIPFEGG